MEEYKSPAESVQKHVSYLLTRLAGNLTLDCYIKSGSIWGFDMVGTGPHTKLVCNIAQSRI